MTGSRPRLIALVWKESPEEWILREQVLRRTAALRRRGFPTHVTFSCCPDDGGGMTNYDGVPVKIDASASAITALVRFTRSLRGRQEPHVDGRTVIVARGAVAVVAALLARRVAGSAPKVVYDVRGWSAGESRDKGERWLKHRAIAQFERLAFSRADHVIVVSQALVGVALMYGTLPDRISLVPHYVDNGDAEAVSGEPPVESPADVVLVGNSRSQYQGEREVRARLVDLAVRLPSRTFGWLDAAYEGQAVEQILPNLWRRKVSPEEVAAYVRSARVGLTSVRKTRQTAVAVTTKATHYLAAGCALVTSPFPPATAEICMLTGAGRVVSSMDGAEWAEAVDLALNSGTVLNPPDLNLAVLDRWVHILERLHDS